MQIVDNCIFQLKMKCEYLLLVYEFKNSYIFTFSVQRFKRSVIRNLDQEGRRRMQVTRSPEPRGMLTILFR